MKTNMTRASNWDATTLCDNAAWRSGDYGIADTAKSRRYSFRMLRYWFIERLLQQYATSLGRKPRVLEVGVDRGQMKAFVDGAAKGSAPYACWDAADCAPDQRALNAAGYPECHVLNLDDASDLAKFALDRRGQYDVVILLHVLEHLRQPERAVTFLSTLVPPGGALMGGLPILPPVIASIRERQLRRHARPLGHITAFSPLRVRNMAQIAGLTVDFASGAFGLRASGSPLENQAWWLKLNLWFGALLPGWPGELYWQLSKPSVAARANVTANAPHGAALAMAMQRTSGH